VSAASQCSLADAPTQKGNRLAPRPNPTPPKPSSQTPSSHRSRYFSNVAALATHEKTKPHRRRAKLLLASARPHNQVDAEVASGMGRPDNGPRLRSGGGVADMAE